MLLSPVCDLGQLADDMYAVLCTLVSVYTQMWMSVLLVQITAVQTPTVTTHTGPTRAHVKLDLQATDSTVTVRPNDLFVSRTQFGENVRTKELFVFLFFLTLYFMTTREYYTTGGRNRTKTKQ